MTYFGKQNFGRESESTSSSQLLMYKALGDPLTRTTPASESNDIKSKLANN